jgi:hypothetical protein
MAAASPRNAAALFFYFPGQAREHRADWHAMSFHSVSIGDHECDDRSADSHAAIDL